MIRRNGLRMVRGIEEFWRPDNIANSTAAGRAWKANELRLKSFEDLHKLWYVCLKEKNLLETERHMARATKTEFKNDWRLPAVKTSMARIKTVINERRKRGEDLPNVSSPVK